MLSFLLSAKQALYSCLKECTLITGDTEGNKNPVILIISGLLIKGIIEIFVIYKELYHLISTS